MRMSCNGCRVLRKGCSENCSIRPCLQWIKSPESQANATVFLAKFYGRAGLVNLINSGGPHHLRPAIFRSLLYEACGRIVNPIYGSVGLLCSDSWHLCQAAVDSVLKGEPIVQIPSDDAARSPAPPLKAHDIRHASGGSHVAASRPGTAELHGVRRNRTRFKRAGTRRASRGPAESSGSHATEHDESSASHVSQGAPAEESEVELELTLGFEPRGRLPRTVRAVPDSRHDDGDTCHVDLGLELSA